MQHVGTVGFGQQFRWRDRELECVGRPASSSRWPVYNTVGQNMHRNRSRGNADCATHAVQRDNGVGRLMRPANQAVRPARLATSVISSYASTGFRIWTWNPPSSALSAWTLLAKAVSATAGSCCAV